MTGVVPAPGSVVWFLQDGRGHDAGTGPRTSEFHRRLPGYAVTPLMSSPRLAANHGLGEVWVKDESQRVGLPSFKILGASWATYRALQEIGGFDDSDWRSLGELAELVAARTPVVRLAAATDGNHGRAVARVAAWLGLRASIFVPRGTSAARIEAITREGATLEVVDGGYGDAVNRSADEASEDCLVVSDTSWEGYEDIPRAVVEGYSTIFEEAEEQRSRLGGSAFDVVVVQAGVGALAGAAARTYRSAGRDARLVCVEPLSAACLLMSMRHGSRVSIPGPHASIMVGLNCDTPSLVAWPEVSRAFDVFVAIDDDAARAAMRELASEGVVSGETGAAGLAGLIEISSGIATEAGAHIALGSHSRVLVISTEGATDPASYARIVSAPPKVSRGVAEAAP